MSGKNKDMKNITLNNTTSTNICLLFKYVTDNIYNKSYNIIEFFLQTCLTDNNDKIDLINELKCFSFYSIENYIYDDTDKSELFELMDILTDKKIEVIRGEKSIDYNSLGKLCKLINPPLKAYKPIPHNKTNITKSNKSYALLFDK
jgi:hypothetical protein